MSATRAFSICKHFYSTKPASTGPLSNIKILDMTRIVAGPYCTMILGDMGADIIKIENPEGGDESRKWGPPFINGTSESCYFACLNRNKRSICIDIKKSDGAGLVRQLAEKCDVLVENYVPGKLTQFGLDFESLRKVAPRLIYCSLTGYGRRGPYKNRPGYDVIAASVGGFMHITGPRGGEPCKAGVAMTDIATGLYAHGAILAALLKRNITNVGEKIDCNLLSTQLACLINIGGNFLNAGWEGEKWGSAHASIVPYKAYPTADRYITVGAGSDKQFADLCGKMNLPSIAEDVRFRTNEDRVRNREILDKILEETFKTRTTKEWEDFFKNASFPFGPVNSLEEAFSDRHVQEIGLIREIDHPVAGRVKMVGPAVEFLSSPAEIRLPPPLLGQHTDQVLKEILNYSSADIQLLRKDSIVS